MAITTIADMQIVPSKFTEYTLQRTTEKSMLVKAGVTSTNEILSELINGTPKGGRFIEMPFFKALTGEDEVFGEDSLEATGIETGSATATLLMRQHAWGDTDLSAVLGGADPMGAVANLLGDWWAQKEQSVLLAILNGIMNPTNGALKEHVNDISTASESVINVGATLETKGIMGDAFDKLGAVFMHSATYTELQKQQQIVNEYNATLQINIPRYLGYDVIVDDGMPVETIGGAKVYSTYFMGRGVIARADGTPKWFTPVETDRDKLGATNYLINRRAFIMHPQGFSWTATGNGVYENTKHKYPSNADLKKPENWELATDHKNVPIVCLRHKIS